MTRRSRWRVVTVVAAVCLLVSAAMTWTLVPPAQLTAEEQALLGTYTLSVAGVAEPAYALTLHADRTCTYDYFSGFTTGGADSWWRLHNGELSITHRYQIVPYTGGPTLPFLRKAETDRWRLGEPDMSGEIPLISTGSLANATLAKRD